MSLRFSGDDYVRVALPDKQGGMEESENDLRGFIEEPVRPASPPQDTSASIWSLKFHQHLFDVDTQQVLRRLACALIPNPRISFVQHTLRPHADLYGPFWIATTLILAAAIGGNVSSYLHSHGQATSWRYDFRKVTLASTIIYLYWWFAPLGLTAFAYVRSKRAQQANENEDRSSLLDSGRSLSVPTHKFVDLLSVYGYSLTVFVPVSILWAIPNSIFQWLLVVVAMVVSSAFLAFALFPLFRKDHSKVTFFHGSGSIPSVAGPAPAPVAPVDVPVIKPLAKPVNMLSKRSV